MNRKHKEMYVLFLKCQKYRDWRDDEFSSISDQTDSSATLLPNQIQTLLKGKRKPSVCPLSVDFRSIFFVSYIHKCLLPLILTEALKIDIDSL